MRATFALLAVTGLTLEVRPFGKIIMILNGMS